VKQHNIGGDLSSVFFNSALITIVEETHHHSRPLAEDTAPGYLSLVIIFFIIDCLLSIRKCCLTSALKKERPSAGTYERPHSGNPVHACSAPTCAVQHWSAAWNRTPENHRTEMGWLRFPGASQQTMPQCLQN